MTADGVRSLIEDLRSAIKRHDLDAFLACFDEAYESEQPLRPECSFRGRDGVRRNWSANLANVADHVAGILAAKDNAFGVVGVAPGARIFCTATERCARTRGVAIQGPGIHYASW